jgi:feruloyl esterase
LARIKTVSDALYAKCDKLDGTDDGVIDDPRKCDFDPAALCV